MSKKKVGMRYFSPWDGSHVFLDLRVDRCLRKMRTTQERKRWVADEQLREEHPELKLRGGRSFSMVPNAWDDIPHKRRPWKSWKYKQKNRH